MSARRLSTLDDFSLGGRDLRKNLKYGITSDCKLDLRSHPA